jgi:hypothetical protein
MIIACVQFASIAQVANADRRPNDREVVILEVPNSAFELAQRLPLSSTIPKDFILVTGRLENPHERNGQKMVELKIDRVLKGDVKAGKILTKDEFPFFCMGLIPASRSFANGEPLACFLTRKSEKWTIIELRKLTPRFLALFEATTGENQAKKLRPLITPQGLDHETVEMIKIFASAKQVDPLLKEIIRETPKLLEPYKGAPGPSYDARWQKRMKLVSYRLTPALDILTEHTDWKDARLIDLILPCYAPLMDNGGEGFRSYLNYYLVGICRTVHLDSVKPELRERQVKAIRDMFLRETEGFGNRWSSTGSSACSGLAYIADSNSITRLLREQSRRPVRRSHSTIAATLFLICFENKRSDTDLLRVKKAWFDAIATLHEKDTLSDHGLAKSYATSFASEVAGGLYRMGVSDAEKESLRTIYEQTKVPWLRGALVRFFKKSEPPKAESKGDSPTKTGVYRVGESPVALLANGASR